MPTRPQIMPFRPPRKVGFFSLVRNMSMKIQVIMATAVARLVLTTAAAASAPAKYGSPPLKPFQPSHRIPAPTATNSRLFGMARSRSRLSLGPITAAAADEVGPPAVKPFPAEPQDPGTDGDEQQVVRDGALAVALEPGPDHRGG